MLIIYHSRDLDGFTSGAILKRKFPQADLLGYDYGQDIPLIDDGEDVILVDVSFPIPLLFEICQRVNSFVWIDHHVSAINEFNTYPDAPKNLTVVLENGIAACEIAWTWAFPDIEMPLAVRLLGMYDTWRNANLDMWEGQIMPFQYGMRAHCAGPLSFPQYVLEQNAEFEVNGIIHTGKTLLEYQREQDKRACKGAFVFLWGNYRVIALNGGGFSSTAFKSVYDSEKHDLMMPFIFNGKFWVVSIYTEKDIDCSEIAKKLGGGGHKKAAGFQVPTYDLLPFNLIPA